MAAPSPRKIEANRRNAQKSTGPRTTEGKAASRRNGLTHGLAAEVLVPEEDRAAFEATLARWGREAGPDNVVEEQLVRRAAVASVQLARIEQAAERARERAAREAVAGWERRKQASARRLGQRLLVDAAGVVPELEATAFGCDWMIRQWLALMAPLRLGRGWGMEALQRAQSLLGLPWVAPEAGAEPAVRRLWILAAAAEPSQVRSIGRIGTESDLPDNPAVARAALGRFAGLQVERLAALRDASWEAVEAPDREAVARLAASADVSPEGQLRHRYEVSADRSCNAAIRLFLNVRDRRRRELLAIAKEAAAIGDTPRAPVGGGWWRESDSDPAPPGFARLPDPAPTVAPAAVAAFPPAPSPTEPPHLQNGPGSAAPPCPIASAPATMPADAPPAMAPPPAPARPATPTPPARSEPNAATDCRSFDGRNGGPGKTLRRRPLDPPAVPDWRTDPVSPPVAACLGVVPQPFGVTSPRLETALTPATPGASATSP